MELRVVCQGLRSVHSLSILYSSGEPAIYHLFSPLPSYSYRTPTLRCSQGELCSAELIQIPENRTFLSLTPLPDGCTLLPSGTLSCETERVMSEVAFTMVGLWDDEQSFEDLEHEGCESLNAVSDKSLLQQKGAESPTSVSTSLSHQQSPLSPMHISPP